MEQLQVHWLQPAPQLGSLVRCEKGIQHDTALSVQRRAESLEGGGKSTSEKPEDLGRGYRELRFGQGPVAWSLLQQPRG